MRIEYHLKYMYGNRFQVSASYGDFSFVSNITEDKRRICRVHEKARANCSTWFNLARKNGRDVPTKNRYVWDGDSSDLRQEAPQQAPTVPEAQSAQRNLEIKKVNGVWTIVKHNEQLLTWAQACALLKEKVDNEK